MISLINDRTRITKTVTGNYPVTPAEAKRQIGISPTDPQDDEVINGYIKAATEHAESYIGKDIVQKDVTYELFDFSGDLVRLDEGNFHSLTNIVSDASTLVSDKRVFPYYNYTDIELTSSVSSDPLTVTFKIGYVQEDTPEKIKLAIKILCHYYFDDTKMMSGNEFNAKLGAAQKLLDEYVDRRAAHGNNHKIIY